jgi:hypothetical protein
MVLAPVLLAALYGGLCLWSYADKPMFFNQFGFHERVWYPVWLPIRSEVKDAKGNRFFADFRSNTFVSVEVPTADRPPIIPESSQNMEVVLADGESIMLKLERSSLIRVRADGTVGSSNLPSGRAEGLFRAVEGSSLPDRRPMLGTE